MEADQIINGHKLVDPSKYTIKILVVAFLGFLVSCIALQAVSLASPVIRQEWGLEFSQIGVINTFNLLGMAIGALVWGPIADKVGRKKALVWCIAYFTIFNIATAFCTNLTSFSILRFLCGAGLGGEWGIGATLLTEFTDSNRRARFTSIVQMAGMAGPAIALLGVLYLIPIFTWRSLFILSIVNIPLIIYIQLRIPESPLWLKEKYGLTEKADVEKPKFSELFSSKYIKPSLISMLFGVTVLGGYWGANAWIPTYLMEEKGLDLSKMSQNMFLIYAGGILGYYLYGYLCDKIGRKKTYIILPLLTCGATLLFAFGLTPQNFIAINFIYGVLSTGIFGPMATFVGEQFPTKYRSTGIAFSWGVGHFAAAAAPAIIGLVAESVGLAVCIGAMAGAYVVTTLCAVLMNETKGQVLE
ncbi:MAG: hypothetical protein PWP51_1325 [Clostridiales bacterium]|nr:hypothetical protein [Clostridiales bacterium]MDN5298772.1 hypothetical protein [Clostridiales bacterium]